MSSTWRSPSVDDDTYITATAHHFHIHIHFTFIQFLQNLRPIAAMYQIKALEEFARKQYEKSRAPHKPLSDCLDHLRSKNGLPTGDHLNLDTFLYPNNNSTTNNSARPDNPIRTRSPGPGPMSLSALLAQLFNNAAAAHAPPPEPPRKYRRKQAHPQIFISPPSPSTSTATEPPTVVPGANIAIVEEAMDNEANDGEDNELKGFSKSEVTVIDTSSPGWKGDKLLFRKDGAWKLTEKKPKKSRVSSNNKSGRDNEINLLGEERL